MKGPTKEPRAGRRRANRWFAMATATACLGLGAIGLGARAGALDPSSAVSAVSAAADTCASTFEAGTDGFGAWWAGSADRSSASAHSGTASLALSGNPGTAQRLIDPASCPGITSVSFWARSAADAPLFVKFIDQTTGAVTRTGEFSVDDKWRITTAWRQITINVSVTHPTMMFIEAYPAAGASVFVDDVVANMAVPPTSVPPSTAPPSTAPPATCTSESFESGMGGWSSWFAGTTIRSTAFASDGSTSLALFGNPTTLQRVVAPSECSVPITGLAFSIGDGAGASPFNIGTVYVKLVDQATGTSRVFGPYFFGTTWTEVVVSAPISTPTLVGLELYGPAGVTSFVDNIRLLTGGTMPTTAPPTTAPPATAPPTTAPPTNLLCSEGFEGTTARISPWWSGSAVVSTPGDSSTYALRFDGAPGTGVVAVDPAACSSPTTGITMTAKASTGTAQVYVKVFDWIAGTGDLFGPFTIGSSSWQRISIPLAVTSAKSVGIESYPSVPGASLSVDDLGLAIDGTTTPTTTTPTTTPTTTTPTTTTPPTPTPCYELTSTPDGGFTDWWGGSVTHHGGVVGTGRRIITTGLCAVPIVGAKLVIYPNKLGDNLVVRRFDLGSGLEAERLTIPLPSNTVSIDVPFTVGSAGTLLGVEFWTPTSPTTSELSSGSFGSFSLIGDRPTVIPSGKSVPGVPLVVAQTSGGRNEATVTYAASDGGSPITEYRTIYQFSYGSFLKGAAVPTPTVTLTGVPVSVEVQARVVACNAYGCGRPEGFFITDLRPTPVGACAVQGVRDPLIAHQWTIGPETYAAIQPPLGELAANKEQFAERLITPSDCPGHTIRRADLIISGADFNFAIAAELVNQATGAVTPWTIGAALPPMPPVGFLLRVKLSWTDRYVGHSPPPSSHYLLYALLY